MVLAEFLAAVTLKWFRLARIATFCKQGNCSVLGLQKISFAILNFLSSPKRVYRFGAALANCSCSRREEPDDATARRPPKKVKKRKEKQKRRKRKHAFVLLD
jgi:hypothetical protein